MVDLRISRSLSIFVFLTSITICSTSLTQGMTFREAWNGGNCSDCSWVVGDGEIDEDTPSSLETFIAANGPFTRLVLNSPGGSLVSGIELGRAIRRNGIDTAIGRTVTGEDPDWPTHSSIKPGGCYSACAFAFMGGRDRYTSDGELGVHQFRSISGSDISSSDAQFLAGVVMIFLQEMGISSEALVAANFTTAEQIYVFSPAELRDLGIDNSHLNSISQWELSPFRAGLIIKNSVVFGGSREIQLAIYCKNSGQELIMSVSENINVQRNSVSVPAISFDYGDPNRSGLNFNDPTLRISGIYYALDVSNFSDQNIENNWLTVELIFPSDFVIQNGGADFSFDPMIIHAYEPLLSFSATFPDVALTQAAMRNCI